MFIIRNRIVIHINKLLIIQNIKPRTMQTSTCTCCEMTTCLCVIHDGLRSIFRKSIDAVNPKLLINSAVKVNNGKLIICEKQYEMINKCYVVGFGKAVLSMAAELELILGSNLEAGIISVPFGILSSEINREIAENSNKILYLEGAKNNLPDKPAEKAAREISDLIKKLRNDDLLIVLISGGGSALLPIPKPPVTLEEKCKLVQELSSRGADILELNCVRKRLSELKGGGLARLAYPSCVVALILSDVIGNPLDFIASGPTTPNIDNSTAALEIIKKYSLEKTIPESIKTVLSSELEDTITEVPKSINGSYVHVENFVIGSNKLAANAAASEAIRLGYETVIISLGISGVVSTISSIYTQIAVEISKVMKGIASKEDLLKCLKDVQNVLSLSDEGINELINLNFGNEKGICLIGAGEPTVNVKGKGKGGRNLQLALQFSVDIADALQSTESVKNMNISFLSCGTDGIDGPTDAAGAIGFSTLTTLARDRQIFPEAFLENNDSYNFFLYCDKGKYMIKTGHTGTNVMDIHVLIINEKL